MTNVTVNYNSPKDKTVRIFDNFYNFDVTVDANLYDTVASYFKSVFSSKEAAENFTVSFFQISESSGIPVLTLLEEIKGQDSIQLNSTLAYFLNDLRSNATLLGVSSVQKPNFYVARNILT